MKNLKRIILLVILLFLTGCEKNNYAVNTINYELNIDTNFQEKIIFTLPQNAYDLAKQNQDEDYTSLEYSLLYEDNESINSNHEKKYNKEIDKEKDKVTVSLDYNYTEDDFIYSNYIMNCFENYNLTSNEESFIIDLSGEFYCLNDKILNIKIKSSYDVLDSNGTNTEDGYTWQINENNYNNVNIKHEISRDYYDMEQTITEENNSNNTWEIIKSVLGIAVVIIILIILTKFYKKQQEV